MSSMSIIFLEKPCVLLVDQNKIDLEALAASTIPNLRETVLLIPVDGTPDVAKLGIQELRDALAALENK